MATEEQLNNQRELNRGLDDYKSGLTDAAEFVSLLTSRSSDLVDQYRSLGKAGKTFTNNQKETLSVLQTASKFARNLQNPYETIRDVQKDIEKSQKNQIALVNSLTVAEKGLGELQKKSLKEFLDQKKKVNDLENAQRQTEASLSKKQLSEAEKLLSVMDAKNDAQRLFNSLEASGIDKQTEAYKEAQKDLKLLEAREQAGMSLLNETQKEFILNEQALLTERNELITGYDKLDATQQQVLLLQEALEASERQNEYLEDQENRLYNINKAQRFYNNTLGISGKLLKTLGFESSKIQDAIGKGSEAAKELAEELTNGGQKSIGFIGKFRVFSKGLMSFVKTLGKEIALVFAGIAFKKLIFDPFKKLVIDPLKGAFNTLLAPAKKVVGEIKGYFTSFVDYITNSFISIQGFVNSFNEGDQLIRQLSQSTEDLATGLGISTAEAKSLKAQVKGLSDEMGAVPEKLAHNMEELNKSFGTTQRFSDETARSFNRMVERLGFSTEESSQLVKISKLQGESTNNTLKTIEDQTLALKNQYGVAISSKSIYQEISRASAATRLTLGNNAEELAKGAFQAKRLGLEMDQVASIGGSLLDFESSIANEMEAELLLGKDLNLERARQAALQGDIATVAKEIAGQIGSAAEFAEMNVIQQEALAKSVGVGRDELAKMLETQEMLANTGFDDMSQAQQEFNKLVESGMDIEEAQAKFRQKYGNEALASQAAQVSYAKQKELQERRVLEAQAKMADAMMPVAEAMKKFNEMVQDVRTVLTEQMRPFFKELGFLIGDGGKAFEKILRDYVKPLGQKLNDIGLTLVKFARENGPEIKKTFMSILDVFGSIYGLVGDIIKELFNIKGTSSVADPLKNALQLVQTIAGDVVAYIKSIDAGSIAEKIKSVITGIGNFYQGLYNFVKGTITTIKDAINFVKENPIKTLLGAGAATGLALLLKRGSSRLLPMFVKNVDGPGGDGMFKNIKNLFSKPKSGAGLTGINRIVNAIKGGFKGGGLKGALKGAQTASSRMLSSSIGNVGSRFLGKTGAQAATSTVAGTASKVANIGKLGPALVAGIAGEVAAYGAGKIQEKQQARVENIDQQLISAISEKDAEKLNKERENAQLMSKFAGVAKETARYAGIGAGIGSIIPGLGTGAGALIGGAIGTVVGTYKEFGDEIRDSAFMVDLFGERLGKAAEDREEAFRRANNQLLRTQARTNEVNKQNQAQQKFILERAQVSVSKTFADLTKNVPISALNNTTEGFKAFAQQMFEAGNLTEEQFRDAINGVITPMDTLKAATQGASDRLSTAFTKIETKAETKAQEQTFTARQQFIQEKGFDPVLFQQKAERILAAAESTSSQLLANQLEANRRMGADVNPKELLAVLTGQEAENAGITIEEAKAARDEFLKPILSGIAKTDTETINKVYQSFEDALISIPAGLDLEDAAASEEFKEAFNSKLAQSLTAVTLDYQQAEAVIQETKGQTIAVQILKVGQEVEDGTALASRGPFTITDKFGATAVTAAKDGIVVSPNIQHINDAITNPVTGEVTSIIAPEFGNLEIDIATLNAAIGLLQELLLRSDVPSFQGTQAQALLVDYKDGVKDLKYEMERESIQIARSVVNTIERLGAIERYVEIGQQAGNVTEKIIEGMSSSGSYHNVQYSVSKVQNVQDGSSISNNGPFTIQDSKGNIAITHPQDKLVVSPNVSYVADGMSGKGGPVFPVSEKFGALDVKVGKEGVIVQKVNDGVISSSVNESVINHINTSQKVNDGGWWNNVSNFVTSTIDTVSNGATIFSELVNGFGVDVAERVWGTILDPESEFKILLQESTTATEKFIIKLLEKKAIQSSMRSLAKAGGKAGGWVGTLIDLSFLGYDLNQVANEKGVTLNKMYDEVGTSMFSMIGGVLGGAVGQGLGAILAGALTVGTGGIGATIAPAIPWVFNFLGGVVGSYLGEALTEIVSPNWMGKTVANAFFPDQVNSLQSVADGANISNNGPFTIQDSKGNIAITHPKDKLVVSPNVSYIADGATGKGGPVFPVSEKFGALDVKVGKGGVVVQKIKDGFTGLSELKQAEEKGMPVEYQPGVNVVGVRGPFTSKDTIEPIQVGSRIIKGLGALAKMYNLSSEQKEERSELQQEWNENYRIAYNLSKKGLDSQFAVDGVNPYFRTIHKFERLVNSINRTEKEALSKHVPIFFHDMMAMEEGRAAYDTNDYGTAIQLGLTEGSGGAIKYNTQGLPSNVTMALNTYVEPSKLYKNYVPPTPEPEVTESIIPKQIIGSATERITVRGTEGDTFVTYENGKVVESNTLQPVEDGIGFWEVMTNPIGALKHYALPAIVEGSGHLVEALYKTKVFSGLFKKALHKTPIIGQAMHATTGALNISHLLHEEGLSKDELYQEIGKTALITMGGIAGGILGEVAMGALGLATGPGAIVLGMLGGAAGAMLGEIVAEGVADLVGARPVGELIAGMMSIGSHDEHHPTTEPAPNLAMVQPIASSIQKVADGGALAARGPFTITDKFGATAVTAKGDGIVVSPNISYVQDGVIDAEPIAPMVATPSQQHTTVVEQDNSDLKKELEDMKQLMSQLIKEIPAIANRPITIELDGNKVGEGLGRIGYRG